MLGMFYRNKNNNTKIAWVSSNVLFFPLLFILGHLKVKKKMGMILSLSLYPHPSLIVV